MNIERVLNILILIVSLTGFVCLYLTDTVDTIFTILFLVSVIAGFFKIKNKNFLSLKGKFPTIFIYGLVLFLIADFVFLETEFLSFLINTIILLHSYKLIADKKLRDHQQILLLSFFQVVASCVLTTSFTFGIILIVYLFMALLALIVLNIKKEKQQVVGKSESNIDIYPFLKFELLIIVFVLLLTSVFFLIMPRFNSEFLTGAFSKPTSIKSGFSDEVTLGRLGEIKADNSPVMRVHILDHKPGEIDSPIYWRGLALDEFDGKSWKAGKDSKQVFYRENEYGQIVVGKNKKRQKLLKQEIITEPIDTQVLFSADKPVSFSKVPNRKIISYNNSYSLFDYKKSRIKYEAYSNLEKPDATQLREDNGKIPEKVLSNYAQSPPSSESFTDLVGSLYNEDDKYYSNVVNVRDYILSNYKYTRILKKGSATYPIDDFLFKYKEGHCEYFASAMVLILREMGIPSRIVTGFLGGEFNELGSFYLVRESNAHAWVEVYFPESGWVLFDPTPEASDASHFQNGSYLSSYIDFLKFRWSRYVVDFSRRDQLNFFENVNKKVKKTNLNIKRGSIAKVDIKKEFVLVFFLFVFSFIFFKNKSFSLPGLKNDTDKIVRIYEKTLNILAKKGFKKSEYLTPDEFLQSLRSKDYQAYKLLNEITELYQESRFGDERSDEKINLIKTLSRKLKIKLMKK